MPSMNHTAFPDEVEQGVKKTSIRAPRRRNEFRVGFPIYHFRGLRTKACRKIAESICKSIAVIEIDGSGVTVRGKTQDAAAVEKIARADGFKSVGEFVDYFTLGKRKRLRKKFVGNLIEWKPLKELWK